MNIDIMTQEYDARKHKMLEYTKRFDIDFAREVFEVNKTNGFHVEIHSFEYFRVFITSELMEILDADRKGIRARVDEFNRQYDFDWTKNYRDYIKGSIEEEMADVVLRCLDFAVWLDKYEGIEFNSSSSYAIDLSNYIKNHIPLFVDETVKYLYSGTKSMITIIKVISELAIILDIDLIYFVELKLEYNKTRGHLHGNKY